ncbi:unnamed protein product, partial [Rotaria sp. Silwood2]
GDFGIGRVVAWSFAREGATINISYFNDHEDAKINSTSYYRTISAKKNKCKKIIDLAISKFQRIDILVSNAAFRRKALTDITELTHDRIEYTFKTNIISTKFDEGYPIKRPAQPRELASAADSSYIFGEILALTSGEPTA